MRNVERQLYVSQKGIDKSILQIVSENHNTDEIRKELGIPKGKSFADHLYEILKSGNSKPEDVRKIIEMYSILREKLRSFTNQLMDLHLKRQLNQDGMQLLIKVMSMDQSISRSIELFGESALESSVPKGGSYETFFKKLMERDDTQKVVQKDLDVSKVSPELFEAIKELERDPVKSKDQFVQALNCADDPYDIVNLLRQLRLNDVNVTDLFVSGLDDKQEHSNDDKKANEEVLKVYDSILSYLEKNGKYNVDNKKT